MAFRNYNVRATDGSIHRFGADETTDSSSRKSDARCHDRYWAVLTDCEGIIGVHDNKVSAEEDAASYPQGFGAYVMPIIILVDRGIELRLYREGQRDYNFVNSNEPAEIAETV